MYEKLPANYKSSDAYKNATTAQKRAMNRAFAEQLQERERKAKEAKAAKAEQDFSDNRDARENEGMRKLMKVLAILDTGLASLRELNSYSYKVRGDRTGYSAEYFEGFRTGITLGVQGEGQIAVTIDTSETHRDYWGSSSAEYVFGSNGTQAQFQALLKTLRDIETCASQAMEEVQAAVAAAAVEQANLIARNKKRDALRASLPPEEAALVTPNE